jgi:ADP-ribose pyrophosphatase YjhB (NUDIX family)
MSLKSSFLKITYFFLRVYCKIFYFSPFTCVSGVIRKGGKVLLVEHADGSGHVLPGGIVGYGESLEDALKREVLEETGFKIRVGKQLGALSFSPTVQGTNVTAVVFEASIAGGSLKSSWEGRAGFHSIEELPVLNRDARVILKKLGKI